MVSALLQFNVAVRGGNFQAEVARQRYVSSYGLAQIYAALGDKQHAMKWLQSAYDERAVWMEYLKVDPVLDSLRSQRRFQDLAKWASSIPEAALAEFD